MKGEASFVKREASDEIRFAASCLCEEERYAIQAREAGVHKRRSISMARGREKDRKTRKKHRKNVERVKALAKSKRTKRKK